jgi:hypothetical protein
VIEISMIVGDEVVSWAEAEDPESAVVAARTLWDECRLLGWYGARRRLTFKVDGKIVRSYTRCP